MKTLHLPEILRVILFISCVAMPIAMQAQATFTVLANFNGNDAGNPNAGLIQSTDGDFYGTTGYGGANNEGTVFKITPGSKLTILHSFNGTDGRMPDVPLVQAKGGNFYGTAGGGANGKGTFFKITPTGKLTTIYNFENYGGTSVGLVVGTDGDFYGTTFYGGASTACGMGGCGTIFKISPEGKLTTLHSFGGMDGSYPHAGLVQATDGSFYGTTLYGGASSDCGTSGCGTVFKMTPAGQLTTLHSFGGTDGSQPNAPLVQARSGKFYGTTLGGGANSNCTPYGGCGTIFEMTPSGRLTTIYNFEGTAFYDYNVLSYFAVAGLVQATDGNFYGTTYDGGNNISECDDVLFTEGCGTVFRITPGGTLTTLYSFGSNNDAFPLDGLVQGTDGSFYGTTWVGGETNELCEVGCGTVFSISVGLGPFVKTNPTSGEVGTDVSILGSDLIGATRVAFDGTAATFTVISKSEIKAKVPTDASTGRVEVTTPSGTLKSNVLFRVPLTRQASPLHN